MLLAAVVSGLGLLGSGGCAIGALFGGMAESYKRSSTRAVAAEYDGLRGHSFAVIVTSDRVLQGMYPTLMARLTSRITERLVDPKLTGITGFVPPILVLEFQLSNPDWPTWTYDRVAAEFEVERLIVVELQDYRLNEPGNAYLWDGVAAGRVGVIEADAEMADEFAFAKDIQVRYPDRDGVGPQDMTQQQVQGQLEKRFVDRVTWLMYEHQEPYYPEY